MPRITRNSSRLANNNGSTTTSPSELLSPSSSVRTRSQAINEDEEPIVRRSTRRAALDAKARIAEESRKELERKRRSRRVAAAAQQQRQLTSPVARRQQQSQQRSSPLVNLDLKPAALPSGVGRGGDADKNVGAQVLLKSDENAIDDDLSQLKEFTCVICMDKPDTLVDLATISGCTHKFCFDCIDKWAETENKCPCCKQRFRTIDRVKKLPPSTPASTSRRGKRKRSDNNDNNAGSNSRRRTAGDEAAASASNAAGAAASTATTRVNTRTVEDRNQQHMPTGLSFALLESILNSAFLGPGGLGSMHGEGGRGRATFRFPVPPSMVGGDGDLNDMAGMLRMILQDASIGGPSARFTVQVRRSAGPTAAGGGGAGGAGRAGIPPPFAAGRGGSRASGNGGVATASGSGSSPRIGRSPSQLSSSARRSTSTSNANDGSRARRQHSTLINYFAPDPHGSPSNYSSISRAPRSYSAGLPVSSTSDDES